MAAKYSKLQMQQFVSNGMVHLAYKAEDVDDIVCAYSAEGYESLASSFTAYVDQMQPYIPDDKPVVMEISGASFAENQQQTIVNAVRNHYMIRLTKVEHEGRETAIRMAWFLVSFILSAFLLFCVGDDTENVIVQYAYLPFWFFGYRLLIYVVLDLLPQLRKTRQCRIIAGMKIVFAADRPVNEVPDGKKQEYLKEIEEKINREQDANYHGMQEYFLMEADGAAHVSIRVSAVKDVVSASSVAGYERVSEDLAVYLDQVLACVPEKTPVVIDIEQRPGAQLSEDDRTVILRAIETYLDFKLEAASSTVHDSAVQIGWFAALMLASTAILRLVEHRWGKALLEFATMLLWFFGDYLIEFVLLGHRGALADQRRCRAFKNAEIRFHEGKTGK